MYSDDRCQLLFKGRDVFIYREGTHSVFLQAETLRDPWRTVIYGGSLSSWNAPDQGERIPEPKRAQIVALLERCLRERGELVEVDWGPPGRAVENGGL
jgi:hypothetical protein